MYVAGRPEFPANRCLGLFPLTASFIFSYCWLAVNSLFNEMNSPEKREESGRCCPVQLKTGVQIIAGIDLIKLSFGRKGFRTNFYVQISD
jgi:hypothetical protein